MFIRFWSLLLATSFALYGLVVPVASATVIPGTDVTIDSPKNFQIARTFKGLQNVESFSTIEFKEHPHAFSVVSRGLTESFSGSVEVLDSESLVFDQREGQLLDLKFTIMGAEFRKWLLVIGDDIRSITVSASYPAWAAETMSSELRSAILTTRWLRTPTQQLFFDLPYWVPETRDLKYSRVDSTGLMLSAKLTETPASGLAIPTLFLKHTSLSGPIDDVKTHSHSTLAKVQSFQVQEILSEGPATVDGINAYRIQARMHNPTLDLTVVFNQTLVIQVSKSLLIHSAAPASDSPKFQPQFDEIIEALRFKPPGSTQGIQ